MEEIIKLLDEADLKIRTEIGREMRNKKGLGDVAEYRTNKATQFAVLQRAGDDETPRLNRHVPSCCLRLLCNPLFLI